MNIIPARLPVDYGVPVSADHTVVLPASLTRRGSSLHRVSFAPVTGQPGVAAALPVPDSGILRHITIHPVSAPPDPMPPHASLSVIDPSYNFTGFVQYIFAPEIALVNISDIEMWRATWDHGYAYTTKTLYENRLFIWIPGWSNFFEADVTYFIEND